LLLDNVIKIIVSFVFSVVIARYFGPGKFGQINYVSAFTGILQVFVLFGFDTIILKDLGLGTYPESTIIGMTVKVRLLLAVLVYGIGCVLFYLFLDKSLILLYLILGTQFFSYSLYVLKQWYQIKSLNKYSVVSSQTAFLIISVLKVLGIILAKDIVWYAGILAAGTLIEVCMLAWFFRRLNRGMIWKLIRQFDISYGKSLVVASLPLLFASLAVTIYMRIDQIMIGSMLSPYDVGIYSIAVAISELIFFVPGVITNAAYPRIIKAKRDDQDYEAIIVTIGSLNVLVCLIFVVVCTFFMPFMVRIVYGESYAMAGRIIQIYSWVSIFVALGLSGIGTYLIFNNSQKYSTMAVITGAVVNVILNTVLIPKFGIMGAALASVISYAFSGYFFYIFIRDKKPFVLLSRSLFLRGLPAVLFPRGYGS